MRVFTWCPSKDPQGKTKFRTLDAQFGEGFKQSVGDGINNRIQSWPLTFKGKGADIEPIAEFLDDHMGYMPFEWAPPLGSPALWEVKEYDLIPHGADYYTLTATFQQVFAP